MPAFPTRVPRLLLITAAVCVLSGLSFGQGGISISAAGPIVAGTTACVTVHAPGATAGAVSTTVELNCIVLRTSCSTNENGSFEVCFDVPAGATGGDLEITVTTGGVSASNIIVVN